MDDTKIFSIASLTAAIGLLAMFLSFQGSSFDRNRAAAAIVVALLSLSILCSIVALILENTYKSFTIRFNSLLKQMQLGR